LRRPNVIAAKTPALAPTSTFPLTHLVSDRLEDLKRQRALAQEQQERLDREIAREMSQATPATPAAPLLPAADTADEADADKIIAQYNQNPRPVRDVVKSGCLVYFFGAFALVGLGLLALYLFNRH
jgi:hypothetical protein